jgi:hypothetical protein
MRNTALAFTAVAAVVACSHPSVPSSANVGAQPKMYLLTNLHPDMRQKLLYTTNYQQAGLLPMCTEVVMGEESSKELAFDVKSTGEKFLYRYMASSTPEGLNANIAKYFGPKCDSAALAAMTGVNHQGILEGKALVGMSKQAVIFAIGYPPSSSTPNLSSERWVYWSSRSQSFGVEFTDSLVARVQ